MTTRAYPGCVSTTLLASHSATPNASNDAINVLRLIPSSLFLVGQQGRSSLSLPPTDEPGDQHHKENHAEHQRPHAPDLWRHTVEQPDGEDDPADHRDVDRALFYHHHLHGDFRV